MNLPTVPDYVESKKNPLAAVKAYIALAGALATGLLASGFLGAVDPDTLLMRVLTGVVAVAAAVATYQFPNAEVAPIGADPEEPYDDGFEDAPMSEPEVVPVAPEYEDAPVDDYVEEPMVEGEVVEEPVEEPVEEDFFDEQPVSRNSDVETDTPMWGDHLKRGARPYEGEHEA